jgi:hypothetical protein
MLAVPETLISPANTDVETSDAAKAVIPIFFKVIHIFPLFVVIVIVIVVVVIVVVVVVNNFFL